MPSMKISKLTKQDTISDEAIIPITSKGGKTRAITFGTLKEAIQEQVKVGPRGEQGAAGIDGKLGADGVDGKDGVDGIDGAQGLTGNAGAQGVKGDTGATGADSSIVGPQGIQGIQGAQGDKGDTGLAGVKGDTGPKGDTGAAGVGSDTGEQLAAKLDIFIGHSDWQLAGGGVAPTATYGETITIPSVTVL